MACQSASPTPPKDTGYWDARELAGGTYCVSGRSYCRIWSDFQDKIKR